MPIIQMKISEVIPNEINPRNISDAKFLQMVQSLKDFPEMSLVRPLIINQQKMVLGGNMRLKAMNEAGWKTVPVIIVDWSEEKQREFIIKDNISFGEWDWQILSTDWQDSQLEEWGVLSFAPSNETFEGFFEVLPIAKEKKNKIELVFDNETFEKVCEKIKLKNISSERIFLNALEL